MPRTETGERRRPHGNAVSRSHNRNTSETRTRETRAELQPDRLLDEPRHGWRLGRELERTVRVRGEDDGQQRVVLERLLVRGTPHRRHGFQRSGFAKIDVFDLQTKISSKIMCDTDNTINSMHGAGENWDSKKRNRAERKL